MSHASAFVAAVLILTLSQRLPFAASCCPMRALALVRFQSQPELGLMRFQVVLRTRARCLGMSMARAGQGAGYVFLKHRDLPPTTASAEQRFPYSLAPILAAGGRFQAD